MSPSGSSEREAQSPSASALTIPGLLRKRAATDPTGVALRVGAADALDLGRWERRSNAAGRGLVARGVRRGDRVALAFGEHQWIDYAVAYLAVLNAGAVAVPMGSRFAGPELERMLAHAKPTGLVVGRGPVPSAASVGWIDTLAELESGHTEDTLEVAVQPDDLAEILYTSGTTGRPKGVACTHRSLMAHDLPPEGAAMVGPVAFLHCFPIGTQAGQETLRVPLRVAHRTAIALPAFDPELLCALVASAQVARLQLVPAMAQLLVASGAAARHDVSSVRRVILSSAHAPPSLFERLADCFPSASLWNAYALTEAGSARTLTEWDPERPSSVGTPVGETEVKIVDDGGHPLPGGQVGEVWLRRRGTPPREYFRDPVATAIVFVDGWARSGDLGHIDGDGHLHLDDRKKDVIISGGRNISSVEVEDAICEHPDVVEAAVFGVGHPVLGEDVTAAVVTSSTTLPGPAAPSVPVTERGLQEFVRARLAEHKVPRRVVLVDALPRNASGKVMKSELRRRFGREDSPTPYVAPGSGLEELVAAVWAEVLALPRVGADDDFFALGGHSLAAAQIAARLSDALGTPVAVGLVFEAPTVAELARALASLVPTGDGRSAGGPSA